MEDQHPPELQALSKQSQVARAGELTVAHQGQTATVRLSITRRGERSRQSLLELSFPGPPSERQAQHQALLASLFGRRDAVVPSDRRLVSGRLATLVVSSQEIGAFDRAQRTIAASTDHIKGIAEDHVAVRMARNPSLPTCPRQLSPRSLV